jgi:hypothetical protein
MDRLHDSRSSSSLVRRWFVVFRLDGVRFEILLGYRAVRFSVLVFVHWPPYPHIRFRRYRYLIYSPALSYIPLSPLS